MNPLNHEDYTMAALNVFAEYNGIDPAPDEIAKTLCDASGSEDNPEIQRGLNWHFFNNGGKIKNNKFIPGVRTSEDRVEKLSKSLDKVLPKSGTELTEDAQKDAINITGRLLHHIQDMSTPSHVVPVYHGIVLKDRYEKFGKDFAKKTTTLYSPDTGNSTPESSTITISKVEVDQAMSKIQTPTAMKLYEQAANGCLAYLELADFQAKVDGELQTLLWKSFYRENGSSEPQWSESEEKKGFGTFGRCGNNFGKPYFTSNKEFFEIEHLSYLALYQDMFKKAVIDSVLFLNQLKTRCETIFS